jgi:hypothetical protein
VNLSMVAKQVAEVISGIMIIAMLIPINTLDYTKVEVLTVHLKLHVNIARVTVIMIQIVTKVFIAGKEVLLLASFIIVLLVGEAILQIMIIALIQ